MAILVSVLFFGSTGTAYASNPSIITHTANSSCNLPSYVLLTSLKYGNPTEKSNGSSNYVQAVFTSAKFANGAMSGAIGASQVDAGMQDATAQSAVYPAQEQANTPAQGGLSADELFAMVNAHRAAKGLPPFQQDPNLAQVAQSRAPELQGEIYGGGGMHAGFYSRNLPYRATENMISQNTEQEALNWWLNSPVHRSAIEGSYSNASVACDGKNCAMIFTNFAPKQ